MLARANHNFAQVLLHNRRTDPRALRQVRIHPSSQHGYTNKSIRCGEIKRLVMGLDRYAKTPCGFCFVEYYTHQDALDCMKYIGGTKLDERIIRTDLDPGFQEGRQYGYVRQQGRGTAFTDFISDAANPVARFATNIGRNMIQAEVVTVVRSTQSAPRKRRNMEREDKVLILAFYQVCSGLGSHVYAFLIYSSRIQQQYLMLSVLPPQIGLAATTKYESSDRSSILGGNLFRRHCLV